LYQDLPFTMEDLETLEEGSERATAVEALAVERLFGSIVDEVHEEINLSPTQLSDPLLLGVVFQSEAETPSFGALGMRSGPVGVAHLWCVLRSVPHGDPALVRRSGRTLSSWPAGQVRVDAALLGRPIYTQQVRRSFGLYISE
jgi:hypothetical protein